MPRAKALRLLLSVRRNGPAHLSGIHALYEPRRVASGAEHELSRVRIEAEEVAYASADLKLSAFQMQMVISG
jgi:hypothetical protein